MGLFKLFLQIPLGNPSQICSLSANKITLPKFLHTCVAICRDTEKCIVYSLGNVQQSSLGLLIWPFSCFLFTKLCTIITINYKNVFGTMNLNNFIVKMSTYVKVLISLTVIRIHSALSYQQVVLINKLFGGCLWETSILLIQHLTHTVMHHLPGIHTENCIVKQVHHCTNTVECACTNLDGITLGLYGIFYCSWATNRYSISLYKTTRH